MSDETVAAMLRRLASGPVDAAWSEFLAEFSPLVMRVIARHGLRDDRATDCYTHVCGALSDGAFRRLLSFRLDGPARFTTWLSAVVSNLCVDWLRHQQGRPRPLRCVAALPELDQQVYRCIFERRMSRTHCLQALLPKFPCLTEADVCAASARVFSHLTPQQRWQLSTRTQAREPMSLGSADGDDPMHHEVQPGPGPEELAEQLDEQRRLHEAMACLPPEQRLLLRLRYEQGVTLAEIARLTGQPDPYRVDRQIQAALRALAGLMSRDDDQHTRKSS